MPIPGPNEAGCSPLLPVAPRCSPLLSVDPRGRLMACRY
jgi:hypothetical protein